MNYKTISRIVIVSIVSAFVAGCAGNPFKGLQAYVGFGADKAGVLKKNNAKIAKNWLTVFKKVVNGSKVLTPDEKKAWIDGAEKLVNTTAAQADFTATYTEAMVALSKGNPLPALEHLKKEQARIKAEEARKTP